jgi:hypothetical protein
MTYQLRRLRLHGMIERLPNTQCYHVTDAGLESTVDSRLYFVVHRIFNR